MAADAKQLPIGIFDSGVGGLTVAQAVRQALPSESLIYLGDTARVPYGTKSANVVVRYAMNAGQFLSARQAKMLVIACNTASAFAIQALKEAFAVPVVGVVRPGAQLAARATKNGRVGVIGTEGTIESGSYQAALREISANLQVFTTACPLFVPLAEEGMTHHAATKLVAQEYLAPLKKSSVDTLVLGCTHYPLLKELISQVMGPAVTIIDSATAVAQAVARQLRAHDLAALPRATPPTAVFCATDTGTRFARVGKAFLGELIESVEVVDL